jgi:hypothetical protein
LFVELFKLITITPNKCAAVNLTKEADFLFVFLTVNTLKKPKKMNPREHPVHGFYLFFGVLKVSIQVFGCFLVQSLFVCSFVHCMLVLSLLSFFFNFSSFL